MNRALIWFAVGVVLASTIMYSAMTGRLGEALAAAAAATSNLAIAENRISAVESELTTTKKSLTGYTQYRDVLALGEKKLEGQSRLLAAKIVRSEGHTRFIKEARYGLPSNGAVEVTYNVEYLFGYDLAPGKYDVVDTQSGIEIRVGTPVLLGAPAVTDLKHRILSEGFLTDEKGAVIALQQEAAKRALKSGTSMAKLPEIQALCEKQLIAFFRDVLTKQGKAERVPQVSVVYARVSR
jgi:hypothetical protein